MENDQFRRFSDEVLNELQVIVAALNQKMTDHIHRFEEFQKWSKEWEINHDKNSNEWRSRIEDVIRELSISQESLKNRINLISWAITVIFIPALFKIVVFLLEFFFNHIVK